MTQYYSITQLAGEMGISARSIRFYESKGLLLPDRAGAQRVYTYRERARLSLILRGKRLGFSLADIREYLELYESDFEKEDQLVLLLDKVDRRLEDLKQQKLDIKETMSELREMKQLVAAELEKRASEIQQSKKD